MVNEEDSKNNSMLVVGVKEGVDFKKSLSMFVKATKYAGIGKVSFIERASVIPVTRPRPNSIHLLSHINKLR